LKSARRRWLWYRITKRTPCRDKRTPP
jgi:hypothetical protein